MNNEELPCPCHEEEDDFENIDYDIADDDLDDESEDDADYRCFPCIRNDAIITFRSHRKAVFSCALHPHRDLAVTGSEDEDIYLWNTKDGEVVHKIDSHNDTVTELHFNHDGIYLAVGDMAGFVEVYRLSANNEVQRVFQEEIGDMSWMRWHSTINVLMAGCESGEVYIWRLPAGEFRMLPTNGSKCEASDLSYDGKKLLVSYANGEIKLFDIKTKTVVMEVGIDHPMSHRSTVITVACCPDSPLYLTGDEDGKILICTDSGPVGNLTGTGPIECIAFQPTDQKIAATGSLHGQVAIWDVPKVSLRLAWSTSEKDGIIRVIWLNVNCVVVSTNAGNILGYDTRSGSCILELLGHFADIFEMRYDPKENILLTAGEDRTARIFKVPQLQD